MGEGGRGGHRDGGLRRVRSGGEKGFVICCHDLYSSNAEMMKQKPAHVPHVYIAEMAESYNGETKKLHMGRAVCRSGGAPPVSVSVSAVYHRLYHHGPPVQGRH